MRAIPGNLQLRKEQLDVAKRNREDTSGVCQAGHRESYSPRRGQPGNLQHQQVQLGEAIHPRQGELGVSHTATSVAAGRKPYSHISGSWADRRESERRLWRLPDVA